MRTKSAECLWVQRAAKQDKEHPDTARMDIASYRKEVVIKPSETRVSNAEEVLQGSAEIGKAISGLLLYQRTCRLRDQSDESEE